MMATTEIPTIPTTKYHDGFPDLQALWCEESPGSLVCFECGEHFREEAIVRTCRLEQRPDGGNQNRCSRVIPVSDQHLLFYDRHLRCCSNLDYIAVSHVWNPAVSDAHVFGRTSSLLPQAQYHVFQSLRQLAAALSSDNDENAEIWFDYICVPQWQDELKVPILGIIPAIFQKAKYTLIHLDDVSQDIVDRLHRGTNSDERINAMTGCLNARWFSRVWTAMEYVRSQNTKVMTKDSRMVSTSFLMQATMAVWDEERKRLGSVHALEARCAVGKNLVPWNIGPMEYGREQKRLDFGNAFSLLSRRGCRSSRDFFHAFTGVVRAKLDEPLKADDPDQAIVQIATACLKAGDYSPLLMVPRGTTPASSDLFAKCGYHDVISFGLGPVSGFPDYHNESIFEPEMSTLKLEKIGTVTYTFLGFVGNFISPFLSLARATLTFTGPDVDAFVNTVGPRMYNLPDDSLRTLLSDRVKFARLAGLLEQLHYHPQGAQGQWTDGWSEQDYATAQEMADLLGITSIQPNNPRASPLEHVWEHGGTIHGLNPVSMIGAECPSCKDTFLYRVGFHLPQHEVKGAVAYRITGYYHDEARKDGLGVLVKDGSIVGRLVWASRACQCRCTESVRISLRNLPLHHPRDG